MSAPAFTDPLTLLAELVLEVEELRSRVLGLEQEREGGAKRWLTAGEAGAYLGCSERAVYERLRRKRIPAEAVRYSGRRVYVDRLALDLSLEEGLAWVVTTEMAPARRTPPGTWPPGRYPR